jgi:hypothetical protein
MERIPELELMDGLRHALAYTRADFAETHDRFVALFQEKFKDEKVEGYVADRRMSRFGFPGPVRIASYRASTLRRTCSDTVEETPPNWVSNLGSRFSTEDFLRPAFSDYLMV